jgi:hypothetical protein
VKDNRKKSIKKKYEALTLNESDFILESSTETTMKKPTQKNLIVGSKILNFRTIWKKIEQY